MWGRRLKFLAIKFLRLKGTPSKVALGFAVGAVVNFSPTFGFGIIIAGFLAGLLRGSITAGIVGDIIFKTLFPLFFYCNLLLGNFILDAKNVNITSSLKQLIRLEASAFFFVGKAFFLGAFINSIALGVILFLIVYKLFKDYRHRMIGFFLSRYKGKV
jgi:uncharacterized protein